MPDQSNPQNLPDKETPESGPPSNPPTEDAASKYDDFEPGELTSFDVTDQPIVRTLDTPGGTEVIRELVVLCSRTDVASRRFEVEQAWEARLFERGYQHLLPRRGGGWSLPGEGSKWGPLSTADSSALYSTNIYGRDKDIIVAAMSREVPKTNFFPQDANIAQDVLAADVANKYRPVYEKNNDLLNRLAELGYYFYTDDRAIIYTRNVADAHSFGTNDDGSPRIKQISTVVGKLEGKVPMTCQYQKEMQFIQLYRERDVNTAKGRYPWAAKEIRPGSCGIGEIELDKIARVNTQLALLGSYVTGDAMMRQVTEQYTWIRPEMYFESIVNDALRAELFAKFPRGMLIVFAGPTLCFMRNEAMDDHIQVVHALPGIGQNRRALGTNNLSVQKRLNAYLDIMDDFHRRTIPRRLYDNDAFNVRALQQQDNKPGGSVPFQRQPGVTVDQLVFLEPTPQPQPSLPEFCKLFFEDIPQSLSGAMPSLFGASTNTDTVGGIAIQRDQALARIGVPWNAAKHALAEACRQAVACASTSDQSIHDVLPNGSIVDINPNMMKGNVVCYPEQEQSFPESWKERELRYTEIVANAGTNPFYGALLQVPANLRAIADNIRMAELHVPGENSAKKQLIELDELKQSAPVPNPAKLQLEAQIASFQQGMAADMQNGTPVPPEAAGMIQQLQQQLQGMPDEISSVPVAQDESENHSVEAQVVFDWMNSEEGVKFKGGTAEQKLAFQNAYLHWQQHSAFAKQFSNKPTEQPHISVSYKGELGPDENSQILGMAGIQTSPQSIANAKLVDTQHKIAQKVVPKTVPESINVHKLRRAG